MHGVHLCVLVAGGGRWHIAQLRQPPLPREYLLCLEERGVNESNGTNGELAGLVQVLRGRVESCPQTLRQVLVVVHL